MKSNTIKLVLALFVGVLVLESCKKGENDPFLSLRSRDNRISGEWELTSYESTRTTTVSEDGNTSSATSTATYDGNIWSESNPGNDFTYSYTRELTILKDGTYKMVESRDGEVVEYDGRWSWLDDAKKKRRVLLDNDGQFYIDQLKHKEMIFTSESSSKEVDGNETITTERSSKTVYERID